MKFPVIFSLLALLAVPLWASPITYDLVHTVQNCKHSGHQRTWCTLDDLNASNEESGLEARLIQQLDRALKNPSKARVFIAQFSFSNKGIQQKVCDLGKAGVAVDIYVDYASSSNVAFAPPCQKNPNQPNLKAKLLGGFTNYPQWRLHHNKTVVVDAGDGTPYEIGFASGNLSKFGTSLHQDHWVFAKAAADSNLAKASVCLFEGLDAADKKATQVGMYKNGPNWSKDPVVMDANETARDQCYAANNVIPMDQPEEAVTKEGIAPFLTPNAGAYAHETLRKEIYKVLQQQSAPAYVYVVIEHFNYGAQDIADALNKLASANPGVDVRIILNAGTVDGSSEVEDDKVLYENSLKPGKIKVRFIETNSEIRQQMHNKFAILNGKRVFSGAGHYTESGLNDNFETLYLIQNEGLTKQYAKYFKELWEDSVTEGYLVSGKPNTTPAPLSPEFLKLLEQ